MKKLLPCTALVMCAGMACAQAEEKNDWHFNIGAMYEIENVEGYGEDMDGLAEPSVYFNAANGPWRIALAYYQEGPVDYSAGKRGTWFDRPELEVHYQFLESDDFSFGLTGGFRNYGYHYVDEPGKDTANMQRWKIAPDWDVKLTDDLRFNGWLSMYKFANDLNTTGYADTR
ncbi:TPA: monomeric porin OmpG, partial [Escherichia coli]